MQALKSMHALLCCFEMPGFELVQPSWVIITFLSIWYLIWNTLGGSAHQGIKGERNALRVAAELQGYVANIEVSTCPRWEQMSVIMSSHGEPWAILLLLVGKSLKEGEALDGLIFNCLFVFFVYICSLDEFNILCIHVSISPGFFLHA